MMHGYGQNKKEEETKMTKEERAVGLYNVIKENYGKEQADAMACSIAINVYEYMNLVESDIKYLYDLMINQ